MRKTPRGKSTDTSSQDRILEVVMSTMNNFTEKLNSMEERLIGLTSWLDTPATSQKLFLESLIHVKKSKGLRSQMTRRRQLPRNWPQFLRTNSRETQEIEGGPRVWCGPTTENRASEHTWD